MSLRVLAVLLLTVTAYTQMYKPRPSCSLACSSSNRRNHQRFVILAQLYTSGAGKTYDYFYGISHAQLDIVGTPWGILKSTESSSNFGC